MKVSIVAVITGLAVGIASHPRSACADDKAAAEEAFTRAKQLVAAGKGRMKIVDEKNIYMRLKSDEPDDAEGLYRLLTDVLKPA